MHSAACRHSVCTSPHCWSRLFSSALVQNVWRTCSIPLWLSCKPNETCVTKVRCFRPVKAYYTGQTQSPLKGTQQHISRGCKLVSRSLLFFHLLTSILTTVRFYRQWVATRGETTTGSLYLLLPVGRLFLKCCSCNNRKAPAQTGQGGQSSRPQLYVPFGSISFHDPCTIFAYRSTTIGLNLMLFLLQLVNH